LNQKENSQFFPPPFGTIQNPIRMMELEHTSAGDALSQIKKLSNSHTPPEDACNTFKALYSELKEFEEDLHKHIHLENNILFPKSIELEAVLV
jgi:regulator of cell morphogenesis and NO signaling